MWGGDRAHPQAHVQATHHSKAAETEWDAKTAPAAQNPQA